MEKPKLLLSTIANYKIIKNRTAKQIITKLIFYSNKIIFSYLFVNYLHIVKYFLSLLSRKLKRYILVSFSSEY